MKYPINEIFYSLQGEGVWTGTPMLFIRLHGCNLNCSFCDTDSKLTCELSEREIFNRLINFNAECTRVVLTGGEPLIHSLESLTTALRFRYKIHLETNGILPLSQTLLEGIHWVTVSPKQLKLSARTLRRANEVKFLWYPPFDEREEFIWWVIDEYEILTETKLYLQPLACSFEVRQETIEDINWEHVKSAIQFCKENPEFSLSMQMHKILNVK